MSNPDTSYTCYHCNKPAPSAHGISVYEPDRAEERWEILCDECYDEWLHSIKG